MNSSLIEVQGRCIVGQGPESLPLVADTLLRDRWTRQFNVGVVRGLLDDEGISALQTAYQDRDSDRRDDISTHAQRMEEALDDHTDGAVPALHEAVASYWAEEGLEEELQLSLLDRLRYDRSIAKPTRTHIDTIPTRFDDPRFASQTVNGPISLSIRFDRLSKARTFLARRLAARYEPTISSTPHNMARYQALTDRVASWHLGQDLLFTKVIQREGDAVVFPAHPWPSMHSTKRAFGTLAALFDFHLVRSD